MARDAGRGRVRPAQRKARRVVIKRGRVPRDARVTRLAVRRKAALQVIRIGCGLKIRHVARRAVRARRGQRVIVIRMAGSASHRRMRTSQRKSGDAVVKSRPDPGIQAVTALAVSRESCGDVVGNGNRLKIPRVTGIALG